MTEVDRLKVFYEVNDAQFRAGMERMRRQGDVTGRALVQQAERSETAFRRLGSGNIQNVAFQLGDFATQVGAGTSASIALGQQLPQLLGGFGALGAVMGAVVAIGVPLAAAFLGAGKEAGTLKERMDALNSAVKEYESAIENASLTTAELVEKYGAATGAAREFLAALVDIAQVESLQSLDTQMASLVSRFGDLAAVSADALRGLQGPGAYADQISQFREFTAALELTDDQALKLLDTLVAVGQADGPRAQADAAADLASRMVEVLGPVEDMTASQRAFYDEVVRSGEKAAELVGDMRDARDATIEAAIEAGNFRDAIAQIDFSNPIAAAGDLSTVMGGLVGQAKSLLDYLGAAAKAARQKIQGAVANGNPLDPLGAFNGSQGAAASVMTGAGGRFSNDVYVPPPLKPERGGRKSGGSKKSGSKEREETPFFEDIEKNIAALQRELELVGKSNEEIATAKARWELLDEAKKRGLTVNDELNAKIEQQASEVGRLTGELERAEIAQEQFDQAVDGIADAMAGALVAGEDLREGLANVFKGIASDLIRSGIQKLLLNLIPGLAGGGGGGGIKLPSFDGGGFTGYGSRSGGIDGKGGMPAILHPNETVVDHTKGQSMGAQDVHVTVSVDNNGNLQAFVDQRAGAKMQQGIGAYDKALPGRVQQINAHPRKR